MLFIVGYFLVLFPVFVKKIKRISNGKMELAFEFFDGILHPQEDLDSMGSLSGNASASISSAGSITSVISEGSNESG